MDTLSVIDNTSDLEVLRNFWQAHAQHPNIDIDLYKEFVEARRHVVKPYVIVAGQRDAPAAILVGRTEETRIPQKLGYATVWKPRVKALVAMYGGVLGDQTEKTLRYFLEKINDAMRLRQVDLVWFNHLNVESRLYHLLTDQNSYSGLALALSPNIHRSLSLEFPYEVFMGRIAKKTRDNFRRYSKRLNHEFGDDVITKCYRESADLDRILVDSETIAQKTYQRGMGEGFFDDDVTRRRYALALERGWLHAYLMYIRGHPVAYSHFLKYQDTLFAHGRGFDDAFRPYSVGNLLQLKVTEDFCADPDVKQLDFGLGEAEYKRLVCDKAWEEASVQLFPWTTRGATLYLTTILTRSFNRGATTALRRFQYLARVKRYWRNRITSKARFR
jgi:hypothetical protein